MRREKALLRLLPASASALTHVPCHAAFCDADRFPPPQERPIYSNSQQAHGCDITNVRSGATANPPPIGGVHHGPAPGKRHRLMTKPGFAWWRHPPVILRYAVTVACVTAAITSQRRLLGRGSRCAGSLCRHVQRLVWRLGAELACHGACHCAVQVLLRYPGIFVGSRYQRGSTSSHLCVIGRSGRLAGGSSTRCGRIAP